MIKPAFLLAALLLAGCSVSAPQPGVVRTQEPIVLTGTGRVAAKGPFKLFAGPRLFKANHNGRSNFTVRLLRQDRSFEAQLFNAIGPVQREQAYTVRQTGDYYVEVAADGAWTLSVD